MQGGGAYLWALSEAKKYGNSFAPHGFPSDSISIMVEQVKRERQLSCILRQRRVWNLLWFGHEPDGYE